MPFEITSGDLIRVQVDTPALPGGVGNGNLYVTRIESGRGGYYSVEGYELSQGLAAELLPGPRMVL